MRHNVLRAGQRVHTLEANSDIPQPGDGDNLLVQALAYGRENECIAGLIGVSFMDVPLSAHTGGEGLRTLQGEEGTERRKTLPTELIVKAVCFAVPSRLHTMTPAMRPDRYLVALA